MNLETKVGIFVLLALMVSGLGVMKISDIRLENRYTLYFVFDDVQGLRDKSQVKIAGVEIGKVEEILLENGKAKIVANIQDDIPVYANAQVKVKLVGLIGSQFVDLNPGTPEAQRLRDGDTLYGQKARSLSDLIEKLGDVVEGKDGKSGLGENLQATLANLRSITDALNDAIGNQRSEIKGMVSNLHQFTIDLKGVASDLHHVTETKKEDVEVAIGKLRSVLERLDDIVAKIQKGEGSVGKLVADKEMGEEVKKTVSNLKETSQSAKEVLARFTKVRSFWEFQVRGAPGASSLRGDGGIRLQPREHKYYYLGISNAGDRKDEYRGDGDYEKKNTLTAVLGKEFGPLTLEMGAIRSSAGVGLRYYPFAGWSEPIEEYPAGWKKNVEVNAQAFDFARNEARGKAGKERQFKNPQFNVGAKVRVNRWVKVGAGVEDLSEVRQYNVATHVVFEDRDLAYLFGFVSFAR